MEPNIEHIVSNKELRWIFVSGKGGVGKTTTSCAIGVRLAKHRESVLIISTDPAHNISDAFNQKFTKTPTLVRGYNNLYAMEIDPNIGFTELPEDADDEASSSSQSNFFGINKNDMNQFLSTMPGIDEAMSFSQVMKLVQKLDFSLVIFDTAPTGHTLRLLSFPFLIEKSLTKIISLKTQFVGMFRAVSGALGLQSLDIDGFTSKFDEMLPVIKQVSERLKNNRETTFVCVCIAEFLSLFETERLIQHLVDMDIDVQTIIVNQLLVHDTHGTCDFCEQRVKLQKTYTDQMKSLYEDFHLIMTNLLPFEVRGVDKIEQFSRML